jgi:hypothetical protein
MVTAAKAGIKKSIVGTSLLMISARQFSPQA